MARWVYKTYWSFVERLISSSQALEKLFFLLSRACLDSIVGPSSGMENLMNISAERQLNSLFGRAA